MEEEVAGGVVMVEEVAGGVLMLKGPTVQIITLLYDLKKGEWLVCCT